ncbi:MAG: ATP-binding protein [Schwartzia sp.]|nr:ATP-binding protein [Schwartzia sp. (in: firmicutes)]
MERKIKQSLIDWKNKKNHLPLLMYGARQIGKTYIVKEFGEQEYKNLFYVNFDKDSRLDSYLSISIEPHYVIKTIQELYGLDIEPETTLIFFDEIQNSERALSSLKYFAEEAPEYNVIAAGSLLGVKIKRERFSFPVGKVQIVNMFPMDFEEFLLARGKASLIEAIKQCYKNMSPMPTVLHEEALLEYKSYLVVGGMPAVVNAYVEGRDFTELQGFIYSSYVADMAKYTSASESVKINEAYDSLPAQLSKENKKFQYKLIKKGGRSSLYGEPIDWLIQSGICLKCTLVEQGLLPLAAYQDLSSFKLYYSDMGIFSSRTHTSMSMIDNPAMQQFLGALTENYAAIGLKSNGYELNYWASNSEAEVDFVILKDENIIPVECKAGEHVRSRSLQSFMKRYNSPYSIRISAKNFGEENRILSIPLYAVFCIK